MDTFTKLLSLPDHALAAYYVIENRGPITVAQMRDMMGKSQASIYRALAILRDENLIRDDGKNIVTYTMPLESDKAPELPGLRLPTYLISSPFGITGSTLKTSDLRAA